MAVALAVVVAVAVAEVKCYLINHLLSTIFRGQCFIFLFSRGTEQPHQEDLNTRDAIPNTTREICYKIRLDPHEVAMLSFGCVGGGGEH
jgi:hypothetical protein